MSYILSPNLCIIHLANIWSLLIIVLFYEFLIHLNVKLNYVDCKVNISMFGTKFNSVRFSQISYCCENFFFIHVIIFISGRLHVSTLRPKSEISWGGRGEDNEDSTAITKYNSRKRKTLRWQVFISNPFNLCSRPMVMIKNIRFCTRGTPTGAQSLPTYTTGCKC